MKPITLKDLSTHLLLSKSTVSRAMAGDKNVRKETRDIVMEAAQKIGYMPNPLAQNLKSGRSRSIGVIVPEMVTPFAAEVIKGIQQVAYLDGYSVIAAQSAEDPETERKNLLMMKQFHVDGIIISMCHKTHNLDLCKELQQKGIALVLYDRIAPSLEAAKVTVDDYAKSMLVMEHLISSGRKNIVHLQAPEYIYNSGERSMAYSDALAKFGISFDPSLLVKTGLTFEDGRHAAEKLLKENIKFDAIFAFTDTIAIGAMNYLREQGVHIPKDVAIASFSGTILSTIVYPQLTTVEQPLHEMGIRAAELVIQQLKGRKREDKMVILEAEIRYRASTVAI